jgi:hypothetical protein
VLSQIRLSSIELKSWLEKETGSVLTPVQAQAQKQREETRNALQNLAEASKLLLDTSQKEIEKRNMKVYNRARALNKLATLFVERIKKLKIPEQVSYDSLSTFANEAHKTLIVIEVDIKNWFPRISPFFIMDRRKFLPVFEKTKSIVNSLSDFVNKEYVKSKTLEKTWEIISEIQIMEQQLKTVEEVQAKLQDERLRLEKEIIDLKKQASQVKGAATLEQLAQYEKEQDNISSELKQALSHLQKPFLKMQALATFGGGGGITPDELKMIGLYMENPFEAITAETTGCPILNQILEKLSSFLKEDKLKLKPDKQRKADEAVNELLKTDLLAQLYNKSINLYKCKKQLLASSEMEEAKRCLAASNEQLEILKSRKGSIEIDERIKQNQHQEILEKIRALKKTIEQNVLSFMGKQIQIQ